MPPTVKGGHKLAYLVVCLCALAIVILNWYDSNAATRSNIESILLANSAPQEKLEDLAPYVRVGENISAVHSRVAPIKDEEFSIDHPTEHAYLFRKSSLVLAVRQGGTVVGIGRHRHGVVSGTDWLAPPQW